MKKIYFITARIIVDNKNRNAPTLEDCKTAIENALETPDNGTFGIISVRVEAKEEL